MDSWVEKIVGAFSSNLDEIVAFAVDHLEGEADALDEEIQGAARDVGMCTRHTNARTAGFICKLRSSIARMTAELPAELLAGGSRAALEGQIEDGWPLPRPTSRHRSQPGSQSPLEGVIAGAAVQVAVHSPEAVA